MSKPGLSMQRHREIGLELATIADRLTSLATEAGNAYPLTGPRGALHRQLNTAIGRLARARSAGENVMFAEHGDAGSVLVYYPPREVRGAYLAELDAEADAREVIAEAEEDAREYQVNPI